MVELSPPEDWSAPDGATQTRRLNSEWESLLTALITA
jgi:hypothetical protein